MTTNRPRILLSSIFQPCGVDDAYGRRECVPEVQHNQLTQWQGIYSPRYWWPTMGLHLIGNNIDCGATVLDWPTLKEFENEVKKGYDYVGIGFIHPTFLKFKKMAERVRELSPRSKIIAGGFGATLSNLARECEVDYICQGEGIRFMRDLLGQDPRFTFNHPQLHNEVVEFMGVPLRPLQYILRGLKQDLSGLYNNVIVTGLGCTNGCEFCSTSHYYNCSFLPFLRTGREIFDEMRKWTKVTGSNGFMFLGDENFFLDRGRAEELWKLQRDSEEEYIIRLAFGSIDQLEKYDVEMLAETDYDHLWVGLESDQFPYPKTRGRDVRGVLDGLRSVGIKLVLSSILFLEEHTRENIGRDVDFHLSLKPEHSQFAGLAVIEGTPLYERMNEEGRILNSIPLEERHAFKQIWFSHPEFSPFESEVYQREAYLRDFHELGPSSLRTMMTNLRALENLEKMKGPRIQKRVRRMRTEVESAKALTYGAALAAEDEPMREMLMSWLREIEGALGRLTPQEKLKARLIAEAARLKKLRMKAPVHQIQPRSRRRVYPPR